MRGLQKTLSEESESKRSLVQVRRTQQVRQLSDREELSIKILEILIFKVVDGPVLDFLLFFLIFIIVNLSLFVKSESAKVLHVLHLPTGCFTHRLADLRHLYWPCIISSLWCGLGILTS
jgi:hypothetical protein